MQKDSAQKRLSQDEDMVGVQESSVVQHTVEVLRAAERGDFGRSVFLGTQPQAAELSLALNAFLDSAKRWHEDCTKLRKQVDLDEEISRLLKPSLSIQDVAEIVVRASVSLIGDMAIMLSLDGPTQDIEVIAAFHSDPGTLPAFWNAVKEYPIRAEAKLVSRVANSRKPLLIKDAGSLARLCPSAPAYQDLRVRSLLLTPITTDRRVLGMLITATSPGARTFDKEDVDLSMIMSNHAATALENARLFAEESRLARESQTLYSISQSILSSLDLQERMEIMVANLANAAVADRALLLELEKEEWVLAASYGLSEDEQRIFDFVRPSLKGSWLWGRQREPTIVSAAHMMEWLGSLAVMLDVSESLVVPVTLGGEAQFIAVLYRPAEGEFSSDAIRLCRAVAGIASVAIEKGKEMAVQRQIVDTLRGSLLPAEVPQVDGLVIGTEFEQAEVSTGLAGDLYDFIPLPDGGWGIVIADVSGKGLSAATRIAMTKYAIRSYAVEDPSPASVLDRTNHALIHQIGEAFATAIYLRYDANTKSISGANAGHPSLMHCDAYGRFCRRYGASGPPLGAFDGIQYEEFKVDTRAGDKLLMFTDGIMEARSDSKLFGLSGVEDVLRRYGALPPYALADRLASMARDFAGGRLRDDMAIVVLEVR